MFHKKNSSTFYLLCWGIVSFFQPLLVGWDKPSADTLSRQEDGQENVLAEHERGADDLEKEIERLEHTWGEDERMKSISKKELRLIIQDLNENGVKAYEAGCTHQAIIWFSEALFFARKELEEEDPLLATIYENRGSVYSNSGKYHKAQQDFQEALRLFLRYPQDDPWRLILLYNEIGNAHFAKEAYGLAFEAYREGIARIEGDIQAPNYDAVVLYWNAARAQQELETPEAAIPYYNKALALLESSYIHERESRVEILEQLALLHYFSGNFRESIFFFKKELDVHFFKESKDAERLIEIFFYLAHAHMMEREYSQAISTLDEALRITTTYLPDGADKDKKKAYIYHSVGYVHIEQKNYTEALSFFKKKEMPLRLAYESEDLESICLLYRSIAMTYARQGAIPQALVYAKRALVVADSLPEDQELLYTLHIDIANLYISMGLSRPALYALKKALLLWYDTLYREPLEGSGIYNLIGNAFCISGEYDVALFYFEKAYALAHGVLSDDDPSLENILKNIDFARDNLKISRLTAA